MRSFTEEFPVSNPEHTALDLVRFQKQIGGLDAVLTVLAELQDKMSGPALLRAVAGETTGEIERGLVVLVAFGPDDTDDELAWLSENFTMEI